VKSVKLDVPRSTDSTLKLDRYVADRFPEGLQRFLSDRPATSLFLHRGTTQEALTFHAKEGFTKAYRISTVKGLSHRAMHLLYNPRSESYRLVLSAVRGEDRETHLLAQLSSLRPGGSVTRVTHEKAVPLLRFSAAGERMKLGARDRIVIGFKNGLERHLQGSPEWKKTRLTREGVELDLFTNRRSGQRIISAKAVYGDDMRTLLDTLYARGGRDFVYLGSAGALDERFHVGDILVPERVQGGGKWTLLRNQAAGWMGPLAADPSVHQEVSHGSVATALAETRDLLQAKRAAGEQSVDVELRYFADFFAKKPEARRAALLFVSDRPLRGVDLSRPAVSAEPIDGAFERVAHALTAGTKGL
jgi:hypothetical protein